MKAKIKKWHKGKIIIIWGWCAAFVGVLFYILKDLDAGLDEEVLLGIVVFSVIFLILLAGSVITWIWFGGKESSSNGKKE